MTTNSPNPVDGDVQALIEQCKENIDTLTVALKHCDQEEADEIYRNLELQKVSLAALTAEPFAYAHTKVLTDLVDKRRCCGTVWLKSDDESSVEPLHAIYTTPPAQLLRPVELPGYTDKHQCMSTACDAAYEYKLSVIEALRQQGYEVKND